MNPVLESYWPFGSARFGLPAGVGPATVPGAFGVPLVALFELLGAASGGGVMAALPLTTPFDSTESLVPFW